eukprot:14353633-Alexandrium_andersonii.AAC.1
MPNTFAVYRVAVLQRLDHKSDIWRLHSSLFRMHRPVFVYLVADPGGAHYAVRANVFAVYL